MNKELTFMCREFDEVFEMGVKMGREEIDRKVVANGVAMGMPLEEIADVLDYPLSKVKKMVAQLKAGKSASR